MDDNNNVIDDIDDDDDDNITVIEKIDKKFYEKYVRSKKSRKRFNLLINNNNNNKSSITFNKSIDDDDDDDDEYFLKIIDKKIKIDRIMLLINRLKTTKFTHLITIPFIDELFSKKFLEFKQKILNHNNNNNNDDDDDDDDDINELLFQNVNKLHLTIACLSLENEQQINDVKNLFKIHCNDFITNNNLMEQKFIIDIDGINIMNPNNSKKTNVLYAMIKNNNHLQNLANHLANIMFENGFLYNGDKYFNEKNVKLHLTLMNTAFLRRKDRNRKKKFKRYFDSTNILKNYKDYYFCQIQSPKIQLNDLHRTNEHGYYDVLESIELSHENKI